MIFAMQISYAALIRVH